MSNKPNVQRWFQEVWCNKRPEVITEMLAPDAIVHGLSEGAEPLRGPEPFLEFHRKFCSAFPDLQITVDEIIEEGDRTAVRFTATGTHTSTGLDLPPTGRPIRISGVSFSRWENGRLVEGWNMVDFATMIRQLTV